MADNSAMARPEEWLRRYQLSRTFDVEQARLQPYLGIHSVIIHVRDQEESLRFYTECLGFGLVVDAPMDSENRWIAVVPPDGSVMLALLRPWDGTKEISRIGAHTGVAFETENIATKFQEWTARGVRFTQPPTDMPWGILATFLDIDGNEFALIQGPWLADLLKQHRRTLEERKEAERRLVHEMEIAMQVQAGLLPQVRPKMNTLEYEGACIQASQVGGDYYDFINLGTGHLAFVIGDISGKGIAGALLMANLQANLRSQYALALQDLPRFLKSVNRLLYQNTPEAGYATLFFAQYQDNTRRLRFVNCGHLPPLLFRRGGHLERLDAGSTILGMFEDWECVSAETELEPGDNLLLFTDGITEAMNQDGEEFGESRLIEVVREEGHLAVDRVLRQIIERVRTFSGREQQDDITLVMARGRADRDG